MCTVWESTRELLSLPPKLASASQVPVCRRDVMQGISEDASLPSGRRVIAFDRPPFGLTERPLQWDTSDWNP